MIERSFDPIRLAAAAAMDMNGTFDFEKFLKDARNWMFVEGKNVGIATFDYPGLYTVHWFFEKRGKEALELAKGMLNELFEKTNAKVVRGLTPVDYRGARYLAKKVGFRSYGIEKFEDEKEYEVLLMTKEEFYGHR